MRQNAIRTMSCTAFLSLCCVTLPAQVSPAPRHPLTADAVAQALHADGVEVRADDLQLPMQLNAAVAEPHLELIGADRLPGGNVRMRMHCAKPGECVAFSVVLNKAGKVRDTHAGITVATLEPPAQFQPVAVRPQAAVETATPGQQQGVAEAAALPVFGPGAKVMLHLDQGHMHIHLPVVALASGAVGEEVQVRTPDGKQRYRGRVIDAGTVQGVVE